MKIFYGGMLVGKAFQEKKQGMMLSFFTDAKDGKPNRALLKVLKRRKREKKREDQNSSNC